MVNYDEDVGPRLWMPYQSYVHTAQCFNDVDVVTMLHQFPRVMWFRMNGDGTRTDTSQRPSVNQWAEHERELVIFWEAIADEFLKRYAARPDRTFDPELPKSLPDFERLKSMLSYCETPRWRGYEDYHVSQRKMLLFHDTNYYKDHWPRLYNHDLFQHKFYPIWPSRIDAFWPNGKLPGRYTKPNLVSGVSPEDVIDCVFEHTFREYAPTLPKPKES